MYSVLYLLKSCRSFSSGATDGVRDPGPMNPTSLFNLLNITRRAVSDYQNHQFSHSLEDGLL